MLFPVIGHLLKPVKCFLAKRATDSDAYQQAVGTFLNMVEKHSECPSVEWKEQEAGQSTLAGLDEDMVLVIPCLYQSRLEEDVKAVAEHWSLRSLTRMCKGCSQNNPYSPTEGRLNLPTHLPGKEIAIFHYTPQLFLALKYIDPNFQGLVLSVSIPFCA